MASKARGGASESLASPLSKTFLRLCGCYTIRWNHYVIRWKPGTEGDMTVRPLDTCDKSDTDTSADADTLIMTLLTLTLVTVTQEAAIGDSRDSFMGRPSVTRRNPALC